MWLKYVVSVGQDAWEQWHWQWEENELHWVCSDRVAAAAAAADDDDDDDGEMCMLCRSKVDNDHCVNTQRQWQVGFQNLRDKVKVSLHILAEDTWCVFVFV